MSGLDDIFFPCNSAICHEVSARACSTYLSRYTLPPNRLDATWPVSHRTDIAFIFSRAAFYCIPASRATGLLNVSSDGSGMQLLYGAIDPTAARDTLKTPSYIYFALATTSP